MQISINPVPMVGIHLNWGGYSVVCYKISTMQLWIAISWEIKINSFELSLTHTCCELRSYTYKKYCIQIFHRYTP